MSVRRNGHIFANVIGSVFIPRSCLASVEAEQSLGRLEPRLDARGPSTSDPPGPDVERLHDGERSADHDDMARSHTSTASTMPVTADRGCSGPARTVPPDK